MKLPVGYQHPVSKQEVSLGYLFRTFFKIGLISFGGHMALISVIQRIMVEKDRSIENEVILNSIGIASLLPGPLAVNVVGQTGYHLRKGPGAVVSTVAIILPAFLLMLLLSWAYFNHQQTINWNAAMKYVAGAVSALILASGLQLYKKEVNGNLKKSLMFFAALAILLFTGNYLVTVGLLVAGAIAGTLLEVQGRKEAPTGTEPAAAPAAGIGLLNKCLLALLLLNQMLFYSNTAKYVGSGYLKLLLIFTGISLSLFGGGYVMIPIMEAMFVKELHWLTNQEFVNAIAFSQATPGPILISATFIGYKVAGLGGALLATAAIFTPSVFLVVLVSGVISQFRNISTIQHMLGGIKAVVVALIVASAYRVVAHETFDLLFLATILAAFILNYRLKVSPVYLITGAMLLGILHHLLLKSPL